MEQDVTKCDSDHEKKEPQRAFTPEELVRGPDDFPYTPAAEMAQFHEQHGGRAPLAGARHGAADMAELSRLTDRLLNWLSLKEPHTYASRAEAFEWAARAHELAARAANLLELRAAEVAALQMVVRNR